MRKIMISLTAAFCALAVPATAAARVELQSGKTRAEIIKAATGASPVQYRCFRVYLVAKGSPWALQTTPTNDVGLPACKDIQEGGEGILRFADHRWQVVTEFDEIRCPLLSDPHEPIVPSSVLRALTGKYCSQKTLVLVPTYLDANPGRGMEQHPATIVYTGDGTGALERLRWAHWGSKVTEGSGLDAIRSCVPDCATGKTTYYPVRVEAYALEPIEGVYTYARVQVTYTAAVPVYDGRSFGRTYTLKESYYGGNGGGFSLA